MEQLKLQQLISWHISESTLTRVQNESNRFTAGVCNVSGGVKFTSIKSQAFHASDPEDTGGLDQTAPWVYTFYSFVLQLFLRVIKTSKSAPTPNGEECFKRFVEPYCILLQYTVT